MTTELRENVFAFVRDRIDRVGMAPTYDEIGERFEFSKARAWRIVDEFVDEGRLVRTRGRARNLDLPDGVDLSSVRTEQLHAELARRGENLRALAETRPVEGRPCAANHCSVNVEPGKLMCREHWLSLPHSYRTDIMNAFRARHHQAYSEALERARDYLGGYSSVAARVG